MTDMVGGFPTPILSFTHPFFDKFQDDLIEHIYETQSKEDTALRSNNGGWQSKERRLPDRFAEYILSQTNDALSKFLDQDYDVQIGNLWYNINHPGTSNDRHTHPGCDLAGIFYVKVPEGDCGQLELENPNHFAQFNLLMAMNEDLKQESKCYHSLYITPEEGATVIFPSHIIHRVMTNNTNEDRISIAWNIRLVNSGG